MKKVYIPDHRHIKGANIWIYQGYKLAWENLGYEAQYYSFKDKISPTGEYCVMATDWFYSPFHESSFFKNAKKVFLFAQPTAFPEPWGTHPNFSSTCTSTVIEYINSQKNIKLWSFADIDRRYYPLWGNIETVPLAFDSVSYKYLKDEKYKFDVCFIGGRANNGFDEKYRIMMNHFSAFKDSDLKCGIFIGKNLTHEQENKLLYNSKVAINIHDAYQRELRLDTNERTFKALGLTGALVADDEGQLGRLFPDVKRTNNPKEMVKFVKEYVNMPEEELNSLKEHNRENILDSHTYVHRVNQMLQL
jgi:spore maturation protein CgeB